MATSTWVYAAIGLGALLVIALLIGVFSGPASLGSTPNSDASTLPPGISSTLVPPGSALTIEQKSKLFRRVPEWSSYQGVINGPNGDQLSASDLKGQVVLIDFWTYSCINCIRTLPYTEGWYERYSKEGFVIVGIHSPEFDFEKDRANIQAAVDKYGLKYPIVLDGEHQIWNQFGNNYWPRHYLVDRDGFIREDHIGEGGYIETEQAIRALLSEGQLPSNGSSLNGTGSISNLSKMPMANITPGETTSFGGVATPEMYFGGSFRRQPLGNDDNNPTRPGISRHFTLPSSLQSDFIYLNGTWLDLGDNLQLQDAQGDIVLRYTARSVYLVASAGSNPNASGTPTANGSPSPVAYLTATLDGQPHVGPDANADGSIAISTSRLYRVAQTPDYGTHTLVLHTIGSNFSAYSFTFG